jgi:Uma2 family endonuclease
MSIATIEHKLWTVDDPDLPDETRYEIADGALVVSAQPAPRHEVVARRLVLALERHVAPDRVMAPCGVTFDTMNYRVPDVAVLRPGLDLWDAESIGPHDVVLVVEVVSPASARTDQIAKRAQYAAAGIGHYWIVTTDPGLRVTALALPPDASIYAEAGSWGEGETLTLTDPFHIHLPISALRG